MNAHTPGLKAVDRLLPVASRYVDPETLPWEATPYAGVERKVLLKDEDSGLLTALFRWAPGAELPLHEHTEIEQTYVLEGRLEDEEGVTLAGQYVWRPQGSRHVARAPEGALMLAFFLRPNRFLDSES